MEPLATLHHFVHPQWYEELGAFEKEENISLFLDYVRLAYKYASSIYAAVIAGSPPLIVSVTVALCLPVDCVLDACLLNGLIFPLILMRPVSAILQGVWFTDHILVHFQ